MNDAEIDKRPVERNPSATNSRRIRWSGRTSVNHQEISRDLLQMRPSAFGPRSPLIRDAMNSSHQKRDHETIGRWYSRYVRIELFYPVSLRPGFVTREICSAASAARSASRLRLSCTKQILETKTRMQHLHHFSVRSDAKPFEDCAQALAGIVLLPAGRAPLTDRLLVFRAANGSHVNDSATDRKLAMALPTHILLTYGYLLLFVWVLVDQLGVPLPATPGILAAGALSAEHQISFPFAWLIAVAASLLADSTWFFIGRKFGHRVLGFLCKLSLEPANCVRRSQDAHGGRRAPALMIVKFVPGLATLGPPAAGAHGVGFGKFLLFDGIGATLWAGALLFAGRFFGDLIKRNPGVLHWAGRFSGALLVLGVLVLLLRRIYRRQTFLRGLTAARVEPKELKRRVDAGEDVYIVDLRHPLEVLAEPFTLPGAHAISPEALAARNNEIPRDRDIVLYCTCPSEATSAKTAMQLHRLGIERVHPLRGGFDEWKRLGYPLNPLPSVLPSPAATQVPG